MVSKTDTLEGWLSRRAGLAGKKLAAALNQCDDHMVETVADLRRLGGAGQLAEVLPQSMLRMAVAAVLAEGEHDNKKHKAEERDDANDANGHTDFGELEDEDEYEHIEQQPSSNTEGGSEHASETETTQDDDPYFVHQQKLDDFVATCKEQLRTWIEDHRAATAWIDDEIAQARESGDYSQVCKNVQAQVLQAMKLAVEKYNEKMSEYTKSYNAEVEMFVDSRKADMARMRARVAEDTKRGKLAANIWLVDKTNDAIKLLKEMQARMLKFIEQRTAEIRLFLDANKAVTTLATQDWANADCNTVFAYPAFNFVEHASKFLRDQSSSTAEGELANAAGADKVALKRAPHGLPP